MLSSMVVLAKLAHTITCRAILGSYIGRKYALFLTVLTRTSWQYIFSQCLTISSIKINWCIMLTSSVPLHVSSVTQL